MKKFKPTQEMISAAELVFKAMAMLEIIRPIVRKYQAEILEKGQWEPDPVYTERFNFENGVILDPERTYLLQPADFVKYDEQCRLARDQAGLFVKESNHCPLLVAENTLIDAKHALIKVMADITKIPAERIITANRDLFDKYIDLNLSLLSPFVKTTMESARQSI